MFSGCLLFVTSPVCGPSSEFPLSSYEVSGLVLSFGGQGSSDKCGCMRSGGYRVASQRQQRLLPIIGVYSFLNTAWCVDVALVMIISLWC
ncbi:hypothetical protein F2Q69_00049775 [Brassica cretica]|uniref:Uncharacterized protein n=1 Tax=Brassica cretica TaxID=69181 RepID=A0A8S9PHY9_BRACR|nr:hypothetical protein F2Q69_00049775 [Brassica cretica]